MLYYKVRYHSPDEGNFDDFWLDTDALVKANPTRSKSDHPQLKDSYRRAVVRPCTLPDGTGEEEEGCRV